MLNGPRDVMSGDDEDESFTDFFESLLPELERLIYKIIKKKNSLSIKFEIFLSINLFT